ncbi:hypothetical protein MPDQ_004831, partial [Monascus purpureus]
MGLGNTAVLNGMMDESRMAEDLAAPKVVELVQEQPALWDAAIDSFRKLVGD